MPWVATLFPVFDVDVEEGFAGDSGDAIMESSQQPSVWSALADLTTTMRLKNPSLPVTADRFEVSVERVPEPEPVEKAKEAADA